MTLGSAILYDRIAVMNVGRIVELLHSRNFTNPQHPYTQTLLQLLHTGTNITLGDTILPIDAGWEL